MEKCIIAAVAEDGAIGRDNALLWHLGEDLKYFKKVTLGSPVIMGRRTFESIGRPLPGRHNIVVSRSLHPEGGRIEFPGIKSAPGYADVAGSLEDAFRIACRCDGCGTETPPGRCFIIGGAQLYAESIALADRLYITEIQAGAPDADSFFPKIDPAQWKEASSSAPSEDPATGIRFSFKVYTRR